MFSQRYNWASPHLIIFLVLDVWAFIKFLTLQKGTQISSCKVWHGKTKQILQLITLKDVITLSGGLPTLDHILDQISAYFHRINMIAMEYNEVDGWYSS